jgi:hypothetical protein
LATDPISDFPVAFALLDSNDQEHMRRFLANLKQHGFQPQVVVTDGSSLDPKLLAELWPDAEHQLCVFHGWQDINGRVLDAVKRLRRELKRRGKRGRGRPKNTARQRRGLTLEEQVTLHLQASALDRDQGRKPRRPAARRPLEDVRVLARVAHAPTLRRQSRWAVRLRSIATPRLLPTRGLGPRFDVCRDPRIIVGAEAARRRQVRQDDRIPPHTRRASRRSQPTIPPHPPTGRADEQPRGTYEPEAAVLREIALQMASPPQDRLLCAAGLRSLAKNPCRHCQLQPRCSVDHQRPISPAQTQRGLILEFTVGISEKCRFFSRLYRHRR